MSSLGGLAISGKLLPKRGDHDIGVVDAERGLGQIGDFFGIGDDEPLDVFGRFDQDHLLGGLAHGADDLVVPFVADQDDGVTFASVADGLEVDLDDERAGGIDGQEPAAGPAHEFGVRRRERCRAAANPGELRRETRRTRFRGVGTVRPRTCYGRSRDRHRAVDRRNRVPARGTRSPC